MRIVSVVHDLVTAMLLGGVATASAAAIILFDRAPSREVAGQIGQTVFEVVGRGTFALALILLICRVTLARAESPREPRQAMMVLVLAIVVLSGLIALWITPGLGEIWREGRHAADGTGLEGADRDAFMSRHSLGSAGYLGVLLASGSLIALRATRRA